MLSHDIVVLLLCSACVQIGVLISYALSPTILYRNDTLTVCGNSSHPQINSHHELYSVWKDDMFQRIFYYLLGQAAISVLVFLITIVGNELHTHTHTHAYTHTHTHTHTHTQPSPMLHPLLRVSQENLRVEHEPWTRPLVKKTNLFSFPCWNS